MNLLPNECICSGTAEEGRMRLVRSRAHENRSQHGGVHESFVVERRPAASLQQRVDAAQKALGVSTEAQGFVQMGP